MRGSGNATTYSGTGSVGFGVENSYDWRDFTLFRADVGVTTVDTLVAVDTDLASAAIWTRDRAESATITLQYESAPSVFTTLITFTLAVGQQTMKLATFAPVTVLTGRRIRWSISAGLTTLDIRQLCAGEYFENPIGQYVGQNPPNLFHGVVTTNVMAVNGSIIGRNYRRLERVASLDWQPVTPEFVRSTWEPFALHAARHAFFYQWSPVSYPDELCFASADNIDPPMNIAPPPKMKVSMPIKCLVGGIAVGLPPTPQVPPIFVCPALSSVSAVSEVLSPSSPFTISEVIKV